MDNFSDIKNKIINYQQQSSVIKITRNDIKTEVMVTNVITEDFVDMISGAISGFVKKFSNAENISIKEATGELLNEIVDEVLNKV